VGRETVLLGGQAFLTASLADACVIEHPNPAGGVLDTTTGTVTPAFTTVYTGPCHIGDATPSATEVAEAHLATLSPVITIPSSVTGVVEQDRVTITASQNDPELVGRKYRVQGPMHKTWGVSRRLNVIEITS
jgi:hypothetical protein